MASLRNKSLHCEEKQEESPISTRINEIEWLATLQIGDPFYVYTKAYTGSAYYERIHTAAWTYGWREATIVAVYKDKVEFTFKTLHSRETGDSGTFHMDKNRNQHRIISHIFSVYSCV